MYLALQRTMMSLRAPALLLRPDLHAKYFRFDDVIYLGSANLTMTALGWTIQPNAEALVEFHVSDTEATIPFEKNLLEGAVDVTPDLFAEFKRMLANYPVSILNQSWQPEHNGIVASDHSFFPISSWFPQSRSPEYMYRVYGGENDVMSTAGLEAARKDFLALDLPIGLSDSAFQSVVASRLASTPIVVRLNQFLEVRRRFGELRSWLAGQLAVSDATDDWQRLMRWLLFFLPNRYEAFTANYSEIFGRKSESQKDRAPR
jgi:hypothetical protein